MKPDKTGDGAGLGRGIAKSLLRVHLPPPEAGRAGGIHDGDRHYRFPEKIQFATHPAANAPMSAGSVYLSVQGVR